MVSFVSRSLLSIDLLIGVGSYETLVGRHVSRGSKEYTQVNGGVGGRGPVVHLKMFGTYEF